MQSGRGHTSDTWYLRLVIALLGEMWWCAAADLGEHDRVDGPRAQLRQRLLDRPSGRQTPPPPSRRQGSGRSRRRRSAPARAAGRRRPMRTPAIDLAADPPGMRLEARLSGMKDGDRTDRESTQAYRRDAGIRCSRHWSSRLSRDRTTSAVASVKKTFQMRRMHGAIPHFTA